MPFDLNLMELARPFYHNLRVLKMRGDETQQTKLFDFYQQNLKNIRLLELDSHPKYYFIPADIMPNIKELHLIDFTFNTSFSGAMPFLNILANLEAFKCTTESVSRIDTIGNNLAERCPNLRSLGFGLYEERGLFSFDERFKFLQRFEGLTELEIGANLRCTDLHTFLQFTPNIKRLSIWNVETIVLCQSKFVDLYGALKH